MTVLRIISAISALALTVSVMSGCGGVQAQQAESTTAVQETSPAYVISDGVYMADDELVKPLGRTYSDEGVLWLCYSGSGAEYTFSGKKCTVSIKGDTTAITPNYDDGYARIAIYVDGERVVDDMINESVKSYTVVDGSEKVTADIKIVKLSETANSVCGIKSIETDGTLVPTAENDLKIEFIGDSITCGYGVDDEDKDHHFSTKTEDVTKTYAYKTAEKLDADYSMVSISGYGIVSGYSDGKKQQTSQVMQKYYDTLGFTYGKFGMDKQPQSIEWKHEDFVPDAVVINLGTNDASWCGNHEDRCIEFKDAYKEFIKHIREVNPDAYILCTLGIMGDNMYPYIELAVEEYTEESGDAGIAAMKFDSPLQGDGIAADWHPSEKTHERAAEKLTAELQKILG